MGFFNSGHETTQDIKRLNFSLSQSNEIGQYFYTRLDILVYCTFVVRAVNCEVNPLESLFHFQYFAWQKLCSQFMIFVFELKSVWLPDYWSWIHSMMMMQITTGFLWVIEHTCEVTFFLSVEASKGCWCLKFTCPRNIFCNYLPCGVFRYLPPPIYFS